MTLLYQTIHPRQIAHTSSHRPVGKSRAQVSSSTPIGTSMVKFSMKSNQPNAAHMLYMICKIRRLWICKLRVCGRRKEEKEGKQKKKKKEMKKGRKEKWIEGRKERKRKKQKENISMSHCYNLHCLYWQWQTISTLISTWLCKCYFCVFCTVLSDVHGYIFCLWLYWTL